MSKAEAYKAVYDVSVTTSRKLNEGASAVLNKGGYIQAVDEIRAKLDRPELRDTETTRQFVMSKLTDLASHSRVDSVQLGAAVAIGRANHVGLFTEQRASVDPDLQGSSADIREAVAKQIQQILEQAESGVIDIPRSDITGDTNPPQQQDVVDQPRLDDVVLPDDLLDI
jgi:hypothetical protein